MPDGRTDGVEVGRVKEGRGSKRASQRASRWWTSSRYRVPPPPPPLFTSIHRQLHIVVCSAQCTACSACVSVCCCISASCVQLILIGWRHATTHLELRAQPRPSSVACQPTSRLSAIQSTQPTKRIKLVETSLLIDNIDRDGTIPPTHGIHLTCSTALC